MALLLLLNVNGKMRRMEKYSVGISAEPLLFCREQNGINGIIYLASLMLPGCHQSDNTAAVWMRSGANIRTLTYDRCQGQDNKTSVKLAPEFFLIIAFDNLLITQNTPISFAICVIYVSEIIENKIVKICFLAPGMKLDYLDKYYICVKDLQL